MRSTKFDKSLRMLSSRSCLGGLRGQIIPKNTIHGALSRRRKLFFSTESSAAAATTGTNEAEHFAGAIPQQQDDPLAPTQENPLAPTQDPYFRTPDGAGSASSPPWTAPDSAKLFVPVPQNITPSIFENYWRGMSGSGAKRSYLVMQPNGRAHKGYGFVHCVGDHAARDLWNKAPHLIGGFKLHVRHMEEWSGDATNQDGMNTRFSSAGRFANQAGMQRPPIGGGPPPRQNPNILDPRRQPPPRGQIPNNPQHSRSANHDGHNNEESKVKPIETAAFARKLARVEAENVSEIDDVVGEHRRLTLNFQKWEREFENEFRLLSLLNTYNRQFLKERRVTEFQSGSWPREKEELRRLLKGRKKATDNKVLTEGEIRDLIDTSPMLKREMSPMQKDMWKQRFESVERGVKSELAGLEAVKQSRLKTIDALSEEKSNRIQAVKQYKFAQSLLDAENITKVLLQHEDLIKAKSVDMQDARKLRKNIRRIVRWRSLQGKYLSGGQPYKQLLENIKAKDAGQALDALVKQAMTKIDIFIDVDLGAANIATDVAHYRCILELIDKDAIKNEGNLGGLVKSLSKTLRELQAAERTHEENCGKMSTALYSNERANRAQGFIAATKFNHLLTGSEKAKLQARKLFFYEVDAFLKTLMADGFLSADSVEEMKKNPLPLGPLLNNSVEEEHAEVENEEENEEQKMTRLQNELEAMKQTLAGLVNMPPTTSNPNNNMNYNMVPGNMNANIKSFPSYNNHDNNMLYNNLKAQQQGTATAQFENINSVNSNYNMPRQSTVTPPQRSSTTENIRRGSSSDGKTNAEQSYGWNSLARKAEFTRFLSENDISRELLDTFALFKCEGSQDSLMNMFKVEKSKRVLLSLGRNEKMGIFMDAQDQAKTREDELVAWIKEFGLDDWPLSAKEGLPPLNLLVKMKHPAVRREIQKAFERECDEKLQKQAAAYTKLSGYTAFHLAFLNSAMKVMDSPNFTLFPEIAASRYLTDLKHAVQLAVQDDLKRRKQNKQTAASSA